MMRIQNLALRTCAAIIVMVFLTAVPVVAQDSLQSTVETLQKETSEIKALLEEMKAEIARSRAEAVALRRELEITREQFAGSAPPPKPESQSLEKMNEDLQLVQAKVDEQYQTKVESTSKYRVRLSGIVLMNLLSNRGAVDNLDVPSFVLSDRPIYSRGAFAASVRQSQIGLEIAGPEVRSMRVGADLHVDFGGGFPSAPDGLTFPLPRLRTAMVRLTSPTTTIAAGQDAPFISPLSPSSVAALAVPAFSYSGNLWTWIPQARVEHRFKAGGSSALLVQGGIMDPLTGDVPYSSFFRIPQAGEQSRQPAYAGRVAWSRQVQGGELVLGGGGYYSRQAWGFNRSVDAWAGTSDWIVPLKGRMEFSGEFYYGRAAGGLGSGFGRSVVASGSLIDPETKIQPLNSAGGWGQLKFRQTEKLEWNGAFGLDNVRARDLQRFPIAPQVYYDPTVVRNRSSFVNFIYRPRSDVLLSVEYRRFRTFRIVGETESADQLNLGMGVIF
jgi:hypothetical protein